VEVDSRRATRIVIAVLLGALAVVVVILFVAGVNKNGETTNLQRHGVLVEVTVHGCSVQLGGSGSNAAGYRCTGSFVLSGDRYVDTLPGSVLRATGSTVQLVTTKSDPGLVATMQQVQSDQTSWKIFILPSALLVVLLVTIALIAARRRHDHASIERSEGAQDRT